MSEIFIQTFFLYFIVIDPLGNTPLFLSITQNMDTNKKIRIALSATIIASIILLFFALLGSSLLSYLNISYPAFTIGGGIILLIIAIDHTKLLLWLNSLLKEHKHPLPLELVPLKMLR